MSGSRRPSAANPATRKSWNNSGPGRNPGRHAPAPRTDVHEVGPMSRSRQPKPSSEPPPPEPEPSRGLVDPRYIPPAPEGISPDPVEVQPAETEPHQGGPATNGAAEQ